MPIPFSDPVLIFASVMVLMLLAPLFARKVRLPEIVGLIIAGIVVGPHGFGILARDQTIDLLGTVGLLFIMFLAGLEIDLNQVRRKKSHAVIFGLLTFSIPLLTGTALGVYGFGKSIAASILLASMFSSHTLLTFPIIAKLGLSKATPVTTTIGGTIITDTLALLVLAVISASGKGEITAVFWVQLISMIVIYTAAVLTFIPILGRWFLRKVDADENAEFIFVVAVTFMCAYLAHKAGLEPIIGAFFAGLTLNSLIPERSLLMTRIHFAGNAIFIPFFLLSVGMLVDASLLLSGTEAWLVSIGMISVALFSKYLPAVISSKLLGYSGDEGMLIFGLSVNQAAATLAAVLVGFNIGLFDEAIITGTILMIAVTCLVGSIVSERAGRRIALREQQAEFDPEISLHRIMIPIKHREEARALLDIAFLLREKGSGEPLFPLHVVQEAGDAHKQVAAAEKLLDHSTVRIMAADIPVMPVTKVDLTIAAGVLHAIKDYRISMLVLGWDGKSTSKTRIFGRYIDSIVDRSTQMVMVNRIANPVNTSVRIVLILPPFAHHQIAFNEFIVTVKTLAHQASTSLLIYCTEETFVIIENFVQASRPAVQISFEKYDDLKSILPILKGTVLKEDWVFQMGVRKGEIAWQPTLDRLPEYISKEFPENTFTVLIASAVKRTVAKVAENHSFITSVFKPCCVKFHIDSNSSQSAVEQILSSQFKKGSLAERELTKVLTKLSREEPVELVKDVVLLHTYITGIEETRIFLGVSQKSLEDIPLSSGAPHIIIILLDPIDQDPANHLKALADIANLIKIKGIVGKLKKVRNYDELVKEINESILT
ncbi:MAG: cation:proton antiporter [Chitinispirillaceae bacterium]|nr:cation:proton antiporter [Chitinispirillaceae bacterium]